MQHTKHDFLLGIVGNRSGPGVRLVYLSKLRPCTIPNVTFFVYSAGDRSGPGILSFPLLRITSTAIRTYHVNMRMKGRSISRLIILNSFENFEIIEEYPKDKYLPSYLIYSHYQDEIFHVLFAVDIEGDNIRVITSYFPDPEEWKEEFKTRR